MIRFSRTMLVLCAAVFVAAACDDDPVSIDPSPTEGLQQRVGGDSLGNPIPGEPTAPEPGIFRGTVLGPSNGGGDTLETAPRVADVVVTAYRILGGTAPDYELSDAVATVTTGADGKFTLPELTGGMYVVTFAPPASSPYGGVWVTAATSAQSGDHTWWVVLWTR